MIEDRKIRHSAKLMVDRLGENALILAYERAVELEALGDTEGNAAWLRIANAIKLLNAGDGARN